MLNSRILEPFLQEPRFARIREFYGSLVKEGEKDWDILLFATDQSLYFFQIFNDQISVNADQIYTGSYLRNLDYEGAFQGKRVAILDNSLLDGCSLFEIYCLLKRGGASEIQPFVFNICVEFDNMDLKDQVIKIYNSIFTPDDIEAIVTFDVFRRTLCGYHYVSREELFQFRSKEVELFQKTLSVIPADVPIMEDFDAKNHMNSEIVMNHMQFQKFCGGEDGWFFVPNVYQKRGATHLSKYVEGSLNQDIQCSYFYLSNDFTESVKGSFLQSIGVKCKYTFVEDLIYMHFSPFVLMRSLSGDELRTVFEALMGNTRYGYSLLHNYYRGGDWLMFSAVYYMLCFYVGDCFKQYLSKYNIEASYDMDAFEHYCDKEFLEELDLMDVESVCESLKYCHIKNRDLPFPYSQYTMLFQDMTDVFNVVHWQIQQKNSKGYLSLEDIERIISGKFAFSSCDEFDQVVTSVVLMAMEIGICNRFLIVHDDAIEWVYKDSTDHSLALPKREDD